MINFPSIKPASISWGLQRNIVVNESMGGKVTRISRTGDRWVVSVVMPPLEGADARSFRSFLTRASAATESILAADPSYVFSGPSDLTATVNGGSQTGVSLILATNKNSTLIARAGDRLSLTTNQLLEVAADATTNGSGAVTLTLTTPLRASPANSSAVEFHNPKAVFYLPDDVSWSVKAPLIHSTSFQMVELI